MRALGQFTGFTVCVSMDQAQVKVGVCGGQRLINFECDSSGHTHFALFETGTLADDLYLINWVQQLAGELQRPAYVTGSCITAPMVMHGRRDTTQDSHGMHLLTASSPAPAS